MNLFQFIQTGLELIFMEEGYITHDIITRL